MRWASSLQSEPNTERAVHGAADVIERTLAGASVDVLFVFATPDHHADQAAVPALLRQRFPGAALLGCGAPGVSVGADMITEGAGLSVLAGHLPHVELRSFYFEGDVSRLDVDGWRGLIGAEPAAAPAIVLFGASRALPDAAGLRALDRAYPYSRKIGGVIDQDASAAALFAEGFVHRKGLAGLALVGNVGLRPIVGCAGRPVGPTMNVTDGAQNLLRSLDGRPAHEVMSSAFSTLSASDQELFRAGPIVGLRDRASAGRYDHRVGSLLGVHAPTGAIAVARPVHPGQELRLFIRDPRSMVAGLRSALARQDPQGAPLAALLMTCASRRSTHIDPMLSDAAVVARSWPDAATVGAQVHAQITDLRSETDRLTHLAVVGALAPRPGN